MSRPAATPGPAGAGGGKGKGKKGAKGAGNSSGAACSIHTAADLALQVRARLLTWLTVEGEAADLTLHVRARLLRLLPLWRIHLFAAAQLGAA